MKIVVVSSYPLVDNHYYKKLFLKGLVERSNKISEIVLVYGNTHPKDYYREIRRRVGLSEAFKKLRLNKGQVKQKKGKKLTDKRQNYLYSDSHQSNSIEHTGSLAKFAKTLGISVKKFPKLKSANCLEFLKGYSPDVIHNVSSLYIPREVLNIPKHGVIGSHYGLLPQLRGGDTIRWSILLDVPLLVCHLFLTPSLDMGDVINKETVSVHKGDSIDGLRHKCQIANTNGQLKVFDKLLDGSITRTPQIKSEGSTFYQMGRLLRKKVDRILAENLYSHYTS
ncbi:MAG: formyltransferase family protein [Candidatus Aminicenantaceae bacterium]